MTSRPPEGFGRGSSAEMETSLTRQALALLLALLLGTGLGLLYDLLRPPRRRSGRVLAAVLDLLYGLTAGAAVFVYAMGADNGRLGLWELTAALAGFLLYLHTLSPPLLRLLEWPWRLLEKSNQRDKEN